MTNKRKAEICREQALEALQNGNFEEYKEYMQYAKELEEKEEGK